jgi:hypothetical protein
MQAPSVGFRPRSRHQLRRYIQVVSFLGLTYVPSSAFLPLSTVCSLRRLASLFHLAATCGVHPPGVFPAAQPILLIEAPCPLVVSRVAPIACRSRRHQRESSRLQGFDPSSNPLPLAEGLALPTIRSPLEFSCPRGLSLGHLGDAFAPPPLMASTVSPSL